MALEWRASRGPDAMLAGRGGGSQAQHDQGDDAWQVTMLNRKRPKQQPRSQSAIAVVKRWVDAGDARRSRPPNDGGSLTRRSGRRPCWRRPCGGRSRGCSMALPSLLEAAISSSARRSAIGRPFSPRTASRIQRIARRSADASVDLHRHLVVGAADALGADLDDRLDVLDRLLEDLDGRRREVLDRLFFDALLNQVHGVVEDALGDGLLAVLHQAVDELATSLRFCSGDRGGVACRNAVMRPVMRASTPCGSASQATESLGFVHRSRDVHRDYLPVCESEVRNPKSRIDPLNPSARFAPYLERPCLRPSTPRQSSVPRTMW